MKEVRKIVEAFSALLLVNERYNLVNDVTNFSVHFNGFSISIIAFVDSLQKVVLNILCHLEGI